MEIYAFNNRKEKVLLGGFMNKITTFYDHIQNAMKQENMTLEEIAEQLTKAGITGSEIEYTQIKGSEGKKLAESLEKVGLKISSVYCHFRWEKDIPDENYIDVLKRLKELDVHYLLAIPGFKKEGQTSEESALSLVDELRKLCEAAPEYDVKVLMEDFDNTVAAFASSEELKWFLQEIDSLGCAFDTGNFLYCEEDSLEVLPMFIDRIGYVHCKDRSFSPVEGEDFQETIKGRKMYSSAVGSGMIHMNEILKQILATGYDGVLAIEHFGSLKQLDDMIASAEYLTKLC